MLQMERKPAALSPRFSGSGTDEGVNGAGLKAPAGGNSHRGGAGDENGPTTIAFVLYAAEKDLLGRRTVNLLRRTRDTLVVPISPLKRAEFSAGVRQARRFFLDKWWPIPERIEVTVIDPASVEGNIQSDEAPWPLASLADRDLEIRNIFRDRVERLAWTLLLPVPKKLRCQLTIQENSGLNYPPATPWSPDQLETLLAGFPHDTRFTPRLSVPVTLSAFTEVYLCSSQSPAH